MLTKFYATNGGENDSVAGNAQTNNNENKSRFPEDPGIADHRIPDGGGPADGFINEKGHNNGEGFLNHVNDSEDTSIKHSDDSGDSEGNG
jgi:hypothetical protein